MNGDEFLELAHKRRSIRRFKTDTVPDDIITNILEAARWAMSGANGQPWEFIVVKDPETKEKIYQAKCEVQKLTAAVEMSRVREMRQPRYRGLPDIPPQQGFREAPVYICVCGDPRTSQASQLGRVFDRRWVVDENIANATHMIHLAAAAYGLGSQWVTVCHYFEELIKPILGVPPIIRILNMVPLGYPAYESKIPHRRDLSEIVHYEKYDMSKYRDHEEVQEFIRELRGHSQAVYPLEK